jgi:hypothetical protein
MADRLQNGRALERHCEERCDEAIHAAAAPRIVWPTLATTIEQLAGRIRSGLAIYTTRGNRASARLTRNSRASSAMLIARADDSILPRPAGVRILRSPDY